MSYQIFTEAYEGPIDLFYDLVVADRIDPSAVNLSRLAESFLSELADGAPVDLEHLSGFVLVLALLCRLKARRMLGSTRDALEEAPVESPDRDLWYRLARVTFGEAVGELADLWERRANLRTREAGPDWSKMRATPELGFRLDPAGLAELAGQIIFRAQSEPDLDHLALDLPTVEEAITELRRLLDDLGEASFEELSHHCGDRAEEAVWFMGLLELASQGKVRICQARPAEDIRIRTQTIPAPLVAAAGRLG